MLEYIRIDIIECKSLPSAPMWVRLTIANNNIRMFTHKQFEAQKGFYSPFCRRFCDVKGMIGNSNVNIRPDLSDKQNHRNVSAIETLGLPFGRHNWNWGFNLHSSKWMGDDGCKAGPSYLFAEIIENN